MNRKSLLLSSTLPVLGFVIYLGSQKPQEAPSNEMIQARQTKSAIVAKDSLNTIQQPKKLQKEKAIQHTVSETPSKEVFRPDIQELSQDELLETKVVLQQIKHFHEWGRIEEEKVEEVRQLLYTYSDRLISHVTRKLDRLERADVIAAADASQVVEDIDFLGYLSGSDHPLAHEAVRHLALRPVAWDEDHRLIDKLQATITFEAFDILARNQPEEALAFIRSQDTNTYKAYLTHYAYGRRLAGVENKKINEEVYNFLASANLSSEG